VAEMITAIKKRGEELKAGINNPYIDKVRITSIESIENKLKGKQLKLEDLGEYSNYREQINSLPKA
jgi:hypothetical protein